MAFPCPSPSHARYVCPSSPDEMEIHVKLVRTLCGDPLFYERKFFVNPDHPLKDMKSGIQYHLLYEDHRRPAMLLVRNGKDLLAESDDCTLHQLGVIDGDATFMLGYKQRFQVRLTCVDCFEYMFQVNCYYTVRMLKQEIEERTGLSEDEQQLEYNRVALSMTERTLLSYGIFSEKQSGHICDITIHLKDNIHQYYRSLAAQVCREGISVPPAYPQIHIHIKTGYSSEPITLYVSPLSRVSTLKLALERKYGSTREQLLLFMNGKDLLEGENSSLEQCGIEAGATLLLGYKGHLHVKVVTNWSIIFEIDCSDTISNLDRMFRRYFHEDMFLSFNGVSLLDHTRTLFSYGIFKTKIASEIHTLTAHTRIHAPLPHNRSTLFHHSYTQLRLEAIRKDLTLDEVLESRPRRNYLIERPAKDDPSAIEVNIEVPREVRHFAFMFVPDETVDNVKSVIRQEMRFPLYYVWRGKFVLQFKGQLLEDDSMTIDALGIKAGSTVHLYGTTSYGQGCVAVC